MQYSFGAGVIVGVVNGVANATPRQLAVLQEVSVDFSFNVKELVGNQQFPVATARGMGKIQGTSKFANFNAAAVNDLFFAGTSATGESRIAYNEAGTPTTNSLTAANSATWTEDLGVFNTVTAQFMTRVASAPAAGQYAVTAGVYTFAAADSNPPVYLTYRYSVSTGSGKIITINNQLLGLNPNFSVSMSSRFTHADGVTRQLNLRLNSCISTKFAFATKQEDFVVPNFDFQAFADQSGVIGTMSFAE